MAFANDCLAKRLIQYEVKYPNTTPLYLTKLIPNIISIVHTIKSNIF